MFNAAAVGCGSVAEVPRVVDVRSAAQAGAGFECEAMRVVVLGERFTGIGEDEVGLTPAGAALEPAELGVDDRGEGSRRDDFPFGLLARRTPGGHGAAA